MTAAVVRCIDNEQLGAHDIGRDARRLTTLTAFGTMQNGRCRFCGKRYLRWRPGTEWMSAEPLLDGLVPEVTQPTS